MRRREDRQRTQMRMGRGAVERKQEERREEKMNRITDGWRLRVASVDDEMWVQSGERRGRRSQGDVQRPKQTWKGGQRWKRGVPGCLRWGRTGVIRDKIQGPYISHGVSANHTARPSLPFQTL